MNSGRTHYSTSGSGNACVSMPFGKYRGRRLADVPDDYLRWLRSAVDMQSWLAEAVEAEVQRRSYHSYRENASYSRTTPRVPAGVSLEAALRVVEAGRRSVALKDHPDRGGSTEGMQSANVAADFLRELLAEVMA